MTNGAMAMFDFDDYIKMALKEDMPNGDITTDAILKSKQNGSAQLICKATGIICGIEVFERTFKLLDSSSNFITTYKDGDCVNKGQLIGTIMGDISAILKGERTALNFIQRMSGIATYTNKLVEQLKGSKTKLLDTRKTTPNMRLFEKYAVKIGGGNNHRFNLSDGVMIKDNHILAAKGIKQAVEMVRNSTSFVRKIEVETENIEQAKEALEAGADVIMLDNMSDETMALAVKLIDNKAITECSGNITLERLATISQIGVDFVSTGAITYMAPAMDLSLKNLKFE